MDFLYRKAMNELLEGLNDLMADLEDTRDEAQECLEQTKDAGTGRDVQRMDEALKLLSRAADLLENEEA